MLSTAPVWTLEVGQSSNGIRRSRIKAARRRLDEQRAAEPKPIPKERSERLEICRERLIEDWQTQRFAVSQYAEYRRRGIAERGKKNMAGIRKIAPPPPKPEGKINPTDPDSRLMKAFEGWVQGYNAQAMTNEHQVVITAGLAPAGPDVEQLAPMVATAKADLQSAGVNEPLGVVLADAGYWSNRHIDNLQPARWLRCLRGWATPVPWSDQPQMTEPVPV